MPPTVEDVPGLAEVLAPEGFANASSAPVGVADPGRYHTLFGRDSLITALAVLPARPDVAAATLRALAAVQGVRSDVVWDEEPGKIVHEVREEPFPLLGLPAGRYYGSADATPLFLHVLHATGDAALAAELEPAWRAAGESLLRALERGGGLVRWERRAPGGLTQQGWRDTIDPRDPAYGGGGILHEDGSAPQAPVADADTQAAALAGLRALAALAAQAAPNGRIEGGALAAQPAPNGGTEGDALAAQPAPNGRADPLAARSAAALDALSARLASAFDPDIMALDSQDRPVRGAGSQLGWLLWAGAPVAGAAERLSEPDVLTAYGLRTLSDRHPEFDAFSYHRGSVWPFDSWLGWAGLRAAGALEAAERVRAGVLAGVERIGRYPELYAVTEAGPEVIGISNHVQAWTVGAVWALRHEWDGGAHVVA